MQYILEFKQTKCAIAQKRGWSGVIQHIFVIATLLELLKKSFLIDFVQYADLSADTWMLPISHT